MQSDGRRAAPARRSGTGIGAEKFRILDAVSLRVSVRILDRLRHDLGPR